MRVVDERREIRFHHRLTEFLEARFIFGQNRSSFSVYSDRMWQQGYYIVLESSEYRLTGLMFVACLTLC